MNGGGNQRREREGKQRRKEYKATERKEVKKWRINKRGQWTEDTLKGTGRKER